MVDFRKLLLAFAAVALLVVFMAPANAQTFSCSATSNPVQVRAEGLTELVGDIVVNCTGGTPTAAGTPVPQTNFVVGLNTNITSRLFSTSSSVSGIDALLLIDEPQPAAPNPANATINVPFPGHPVSQSAPCLGNTSGPLSTPANCNVIAGAGLNSAPVYIGNSNIYIAKQQDTSHVTWLGVPIDPPGTIGSLVLRFTNIRANANLLGVSSTLTSTTIYANISDNGSVTFQINNAQVPVATIIPGLISSATGASSLAQCTSLNVGIPTSKPNFFSTTSSSGCAEFAVKLTEGFAASFKTRIAVANYLNGGTIGLNGPAASGLENVPGYNYNTESGFTPSVAGTFNTTPGGIGNLGVADTATRFLIKLNNVGAGTQLVFPIAVPLVVGSSSPGAPPTANAGVPNNGGAWTGGFLRLVAGSPDVNGNFGVGASNGYVSQSGALNFTCYDSAVFGTKDPFALGSDTQGANGNPWNQGIAITATGGVAEAVYEVVNADPFSVENANIPVGVAYTSNTSQNLPATGQVTATATFAPLSTVGTADPVAPVPRFAATQPAVNVFNITTCSCNLLFPFVTNQAGYDTGMAIANTSQDPFGTSTQSGTVTLNYYGATTGGGAAPAAQTSQSVTAGTELAFTLSGGGNLGITAAAGFQGYIIAQAKFQYCHGFAFITDGIGTPNAIAEGYLAIQLDTPFALGTIGATPGRTGNFGEDNAH